MAENSENNIITVNTGLITKINSENGLGDLIKPLTREIHLFDSFIAGTTHLKDPEILEKASIGDTLTLRRESGNRFDSNAILILNETGEKYGYVPERDNLIFSRLMDAGKMLIAKITGIQQKGSFKMISIGIYLVDF